MEFKEFRKKYLTSDKVIWIYLPALAILFGLGLGIKEAFFYDE